jgi:hypothetical protein
MLFSSPKLGHLATRQSCLGGEVVGGGAGLGLEMSRAKLGSPTQRAIERGSARLANYTLMNNIVLYSELIV